MSSHLKRRQRQAGNAHIGAAAAAIDNGCGRQHAPARLAEKADHIARAAARGDHVFNYHRGFAGYRWLCRRLKPRLWIHGHSALAAVADWRQDWGGTTLVNVTGAVLVEMSAKEDAAVAQGDN